MSDRKGFLTAGTFCLDRNITVDAWPEEDMVTTVRAVERAGGGSACNFAVDMRRLDKTVPVETQTLVGADADGDFLVSVAEAHGIDTKGFARTAEAHTQTTDAYNSSDTGRRTHILFEGTARVMTPDHFDFSRTNARFLHLGLPGIHEKMDGPWEGDPNGWVTVLKRARSAGLETNWSSSARRRSICGRRSCPVCPTSPRWCATISRSARSRASKRWREV